MAVTTVMVTVSLLISTIFSGPVLAGSQAFTFATSGDYSFDSATTEVTSNTARLKSQQYATDGSTAALLAFDESSGNAATDTSGNGNTVNFSATSPCGGVFAGAR